MRKLKSFREINLLRKPGLSGPFFAPYGPNKEISPAFGSSINAKQPQVRAVFEALTYDPSTFEMLGVKTGTGDITASHADPVYAPDHEGVYREHATNEPVWYEGRVAENFALYSEDMTQAPYVASNNAVVDSATQVTYDGSVNGAIRNDIIIVNKGAGRRFIFRAEISLISGSPSIDSDINIALYGNAITNAANAIGTQVTSTPKIFTVYADTNATGTVLAPQITANIACTLSITEWQVEEATGRSDTTTPSEYISTTTAAAQKTYANANGNSVLNNVVTEGVGALLDPLPSLYYTPDATQSQIQSNDLTNVEWTAANVTVAKDETGIDGAPNGACTLTSTAANGTVTANAITAASDGQATCWYLKRKTGTGNVDITVDGGTSWNTVTLTADFQKFTTFKGALANPQIGIRIATSGDAVIVGNAECYLGKNDVEVRELSPIFTTTAAVSIAEIFYTFDQANHDDTGAVYFELDTDFGETESVPGVSTAQRTIYKPTIGGGGSLTERADAVTGALNLNGVLDYWYTHRPEKVGIVTHVGDGLSGYYLKSASRSAWITDGKPGYTTWGTATNITIFTGRIVARRMRNLTRYTGPDYASLKAKIDELMA